MSTIGTNIGATTASFYVGLNNDNLMNHVRRLASGSRISNAGDDAGGVAVSNQLSARTSRLTASVEGSKTLISMAETTDGFLNSIQQQLTRMSELAQRATNGVFSDADRQNYNMEFERLKTAVNLVASNASFNGTTLFTTGTLVVTVSSEGATDLFQTSSLGNMTTLGISSITIGSTAAAATAINSLNLAIQSIARRRAEVAADISKFNFYIQNIRTETTNVSAADSKIKDLNVAEETAESSKSNILLQASTAILAQANTSQQNILNILR